MIFLLLVLGAVTAIYVYFKWTYSYWTRHNVPGPEPRFFVGNIGPVCTLTKGLGFLLADWYREYHNVPYFGFYKLMTPAVGVRDMELVKRVLIKDFASFPIPDFKISRKHDKLAAMNPFFLTGEEWQNERKSITPAVTSNKIKVMFPAMLNTCDKMVEYLKFLPQKKDVEASEFSISFTIENTMKCGFSLDANCFSLNEESIFKKARESIFGAKTWWTSIKQGLFPYLPQWTLDFIAIPMITKETEEFFRKLVADNKGSRKPDQPMNDIFGFFLKSQEPDDENDDRLTARAMMMYFEGSETSAASLAFALYELANHQEVQDRLYAEVCETFAKNNGELTYEALTGMTYLENILSEVFRAYAIPNLSRICTQPFTLPSIGGNPPVTIAPGTVVEIPIRALHLDPDYFPDPEKFDPDRFTNPEVRNHPVYLPFGAGPRSCPGTRFASVQIRTAMALLVKNFRLKLSPNHKPIEFDSFKIIHAKDGILINFEPRHFETKST